jgi:quinol monooxygenase YgiN
MVTVGLLVRMEAKTGHEMDVENLLREALPLVDEEQETITWFALRLGPATFAIFDAFPDDSGRQAHLAGRVATALKERGSEILAGEPTIEPCDVLAAKLAAVAPVKTVDEQAEPPASSRFLVGEREGSDRA